jgi:hypothetical protein
MSYMSPNVLCVDVSSNVKLGPIPATYSASKTCPDACPLKDEGCYAGAGFHTRQAWRRADGHGSQTNVRSWADFLAWVANLGRGRRWRHNTGGDLPGASDRLGALACIDFARAASGTDPIIFCHYPVLPEDVRAAGADADEVTAHNRQTLRVMARYGIHVNLSANSPEHAARIRAACPDLPVVMVADLPEGERHTLTLANGERAITCPATLKDSPVTCASCGLCAASKASRRAASIIFPAHGTGAKKARVVVRRSATIA